MKVTGDKDSTCWPNVVFEKAEAITVMAEIQADRRLYRITMLPNFQDCIVMEMLIATGKIVMGVAERR